MKRSWKEAKAMANQSGFGVRAEDNTTSVNEVLERKCQFYFRLEEIWGSRPNAQVIAPLESSTVLQGSRMINDAYE